MKCFVRSSIFREILVNLICTINWRTQKIATCDDNPYHKTREAKTNWQKCSNEITIILDCTKIRTLEMI